ncbi:hypothetical protein PseuLF5_13710 [Pseudomonas sp. LF-5]|uniref:hypothetical protein n=1 Tax=Pseudomonas sp. LF-5 TaxID=3031121 RepID=UPI0030B5FC10
MNGNLKLLNVDYGDTESTWDLKPLLFIGGSDCNIREANKKIDSGELGCLQINRLNLVIKFHEVLCSKLEGGVSRYTVRGKFQHLRVFYKWGDSKGYNFDTNNIVEKYIEWTEHLLNRTRFLKEINEKTAHSLASGIGSLIEETIGSTGLTTRSRVRRPTLKKNVLGTNADKQHLHETFSYGQFLLKIAEALTNEKIFSQLPLVIELNDNKKLEEWSGLKPESDALDTATAKERACYLRRVLARRERWQSDHTWRTRYPLINLRIEAELLIFISQTGINLSQAHRLKRESFRYASHNDGYLVKRAYKPRAGGEVEFEIYSEYRVFFEKYLKWLGTIFTIEDDDRLFPLKSPKYTSTAALPTFERIRDRCSASGIRYVGPRELRKTRINWLIRKSQDLTLVAEIAQNTTSTLMTSYEMPHHQLATAEITNFNSKRAAELLAPGPGLCLRTEDELVKSHNDYGLEPNCINPAGCLFCVHQRDIESFDHIWSLKTYQRYQTEMLLTHKAMLSSPDSTPSPAEQTINRVSEKLQALSELGVEHRRWVDESTDRVTEGDYHPQWDVFIRILEAS